MCACLLSRGVTAAPTITPNHALTFAVLSLLRWLANSFVLLTLGTRIGHGTRKGTGNLLQNLHEQERGEQGLLCVEGCTF